DARLPFRDGAFDAVVWLDAPADADAVLPELARVLRADGELVLGSATRATLAPLHARLARWCSTMTPWSQLPTPGNGDATAGGEIEAGMRDDAAHALVVARRAAAAPAAAPVSDDGPLRVAAAHLEAGRL